MASPPVPPDIQDAKAAAALPFIPPPDKQFGTIPPGYGPQAAPPYPGYMSPQDLAALAAKTIADAYQPQITYLQQQAQRQQQLHQAQQQGLQALYQILAGSYSGLGSGISDAYNNAAAGLSLPSDAVTNDLGVSRDIVASGAAQGPGYGSAYPQLAGQQGQTEFLQAVQQANAADQAAQDQIQSLYGQEPAQVQQLLQQLSGQQSDLAKAAQPEIRSVGGSLVSIDPTTGKISVIYQGAGASGKTSIRQLANGQLQAFGPDGMPVGKPYGPTKVVSSTHHYTATAGGDVLDTSTGKVVGHVTTKPSSPGKPTYWTDGAGNRHMTTGQGVDTIIVPAGPKNVKPPTAAVVKAGWKAITDSYYHPPGSSKRLTDADIQKKLDVVNKAAEAYNKRNKLSPGDKGYRYDITLDRVATMSTSQLRTLGIAGQHRNPQDVYLDLVHSGIPAQRAWQMVRKYYPEWGAGYFSGKGSAAATGGSQASYSGVPQQQTTLANKYGSQYGVDPRLLLAIAGHETQWGTAGAGRQGYTLGYGVTDSGIISKYRGVQNQYRWAAQTLASWGVHTLQDLLAGKAAAYATDPNWEAGVARVYESLGAPGTV